MKLTTVKEQGLHLPVGRVDGGKLVKDFALRPYKNRVDRFMNLYKEAHQGESEVVLVTKYLSLVLESGAGQAFPLTDQGDSTPDSEAKLQSWPLADVMYAYLYSRIMAVREWMQVPVAHHCGFRAVVKADLWSTEVRVLEEPKELTSWVQLEDGLRLKSGKVGKRLKLKTSPFRALLSAGATVADLNVISYAALRESVVEVEGSEPGHVLLEEELDDISKLDMLRINHQAAMVSAGPDMRTSMECPKCGEKILSIINWTFDHFFVRSIPLVTLTC